LTAAARASVGGFFAAVQLATLVKAAAWTFARLAIPGRRVNEEGRTVPAESTMEAEREACPRLVPCVISAMPDGSNW
jgi:hypothetical protein